MLQLRQAALLQDHARVAACLAQGEDPNAQDETGRTPFLDWCAASTNLDTESLLAMLPIWLAHGADPGVREIEGFMPWHSLVVLHPASIECWLPLVAAPDPASALERWMESPVLEGRMLDPLWKSIPALQSRMLTPTPEACRAWLESVVLSTGHHVPAAPSFRRF